MIIIYACLALLALHAVLPGSSLRGLGRVQLRQTKLVWLALAAQVLLMSVLPDSRPGLSRAAHLATYALAGLFVLANRQVPGVWVIATGGALNLAAIVANGGTMPASRRALESSGWQQDPDRFANSAVLDDPRLPWLGDVFAIPTVSVFSVGDVVIVLGVAVLLHRVCRPSGQLDEPSGLPARAS